MARSTSGNGIWTKLTAKGSSFTQMEIFMKESGWTTKRTVMANIHIQTELFTRETGSSTSSTGTAKSSGLTVLSTKESSQMVTKKEEEFCNLPTDPCMKVNSAKTKSMEKAITNGRTARLTKVSGLETR